MPDFSQYDKAWQEASREVPDGDWKCEVETVYFSISNSGTDMLKAKLKVLGASAFAGCTLRYQRAITANTIAWVKSDLAKLGFDVENHTLAQLEADENLRMELRGRTVYVTKRRQKNNPEYADILLVSPPEQQKPESAPEAEPENDSKEELAF